MVGLAALSTVATARIINDGTSNGTVSNGTHFVDPATGYSVVHFDCDVHVGKASTHFRQAIKGLHSNYDKGGIATRAARNVKSKLTSATLIPPIDTYFHVVTSNAKKGTISQAMVDNQFKALNNAYNPFGISFNLVATDFTTNDAWAVGSGSDGAAMKSSLRKGTYSTLNVYYQTDLAGGMLGTCSLPSQVSKGTPPSLYSSDGCNVAAQTMPGGNIGGYNTGMTAVHEIGHWLGLLHTFEGYSCSGNGDFISDTPMESSSTSGCPAKPAKNSCGSSRPGVDPIHNYMDYSTDACYQAFTDQQVARMQNLWIQYRSGN
ncbi:zincin [Polychaeton citri CBS 116435]|uniref:Zincin n=1 Tax=Polychaeton citri CBS 116435 TaxID=1314669 RepID=A0A9P4PZQ6_9PEZI|nr:zincin [Polychaeton citri CBS 116435]